MEKAATKELRRSSIPFDWAGPAQPPGAALSWWAHWAAGGPSRSPQVPGEPDQEYDALSFNSTPGPSVIPRAVLCLFAITKLP